MISKILMATDGSEGSIYAAEYTAHLAKSLECKVTVLFVAEHPGFPFTVAGISDAERHRMESELTQTGRSLLNLTQRPFADAGVAVELDLREGRPADVIGTVAEEGDFDLVVVGSRGLGKVSRVLLGSVSQEVLQSVRCPVLVVRDRHEG